MCLFQAVSETVFTRSLTLLSLLGIDNLSVYDENLREAGSAKFKDLLRVLSRFK